MNNRYEMIFNNSSISMSGETNFSDEEFLKHIISSKKDYLLLGDTIVNRRNINFIKIIPNESEPQQ